MDVEELLAREEIRQLLATYNVAGDRGRKDEFGSVFSEDAVLAPGASVSEQRCVFRSNHVRRFDRKMRHRA